MDKKLLDPAVLGSYATKPEDLKIFATIFIRQTAEDIENLSKAGAQGSADEWVDICHKIKGAAAMAGATVLQEMIIQAQSMGESHADEKDEICQNIRRAFADICRVIEEL